MWAPASPDDVQETGPPARSKPVPDSAGGPVDGVVSDFEPLFGLADEPNVAVPGAVSAELIGDAAQKSALALGRCDGGTEQGWHGASRGCGLGLAAGGTGAHYGIVGSTGLGPAPTTRRS